MFVGIFGDGWRNLERDRYDVSSAYNESTHKFVHKYKYVIL